MILKEKIQRLKKYKTAYLELKNYFLDFFKYLIIFLTLESLDFILGDLPPETLFDCLTIFLVFADFLHFLEDLAIKNHHTFKITDIWTR